MKLNWGKLTNYWLFLRIWLLPISLITIVSIFYGKILSANPLFKALLINWVECPGVDKIFLDNELEIHMFFSIDFKINFLSFLAESKRLCFANNLHPLNKQYWYLFQDRKHKFVLEGFLLGWISPFWGSLGRKFHFSKSPHLANVILLPFLSFYYYSRIWLP